MNYQGTSLGGRSNIEWTEVSWNPTTGCNKVSDGCKYCYAENWANMQKKRGIQQYKEGFSFTLAPNRIFEPLKWKESKTVFVNSMSDIFHEKMPLDYLKKIFKVMNDSPQHIYQILTKRSERLNQLPHFLTWSENIWLGVSVEKKKFICRITDLKASPAKVKFISFELLLEDIGEVSLKGIDWIIVGGDSGAKARPLNEIWVVSLKNICIKQNTPFFFKQWGKREFNPDQNDPTWSKIHPFYSRGGCFLKGKLHRQLPEKRYGITSKY